MTADGGRAPLRVAAVAALGCALLVGARLVSAGGDFTRFVVAGEGLTDPAKTPIPVQVVPGFGYDGQFFLRLALEPWPQATEGHGITLAPAAYRHQRVLYPLLAFALSGGIPAAAPAALVLVDLAALVALAWALARVAVAYGMPAWHGLLPSFYFGLAMALGRDLAEPVAACAVALALAAGVAGRRGLVGLLLAAAVLTRETSLVTAGAFALCATAAAWRERDVGPLVAGLAPLAVLAAWQGVLALHWGELPLATDFSAGGGATLPFAGVWRGAREAFAAATPLLGPVWTAEAAWLGGLAATVAAALVRRREPVATESAGLVETARLASLAWLVWTALFVCGPDYLWQDDWSFARLAGEWVVLGSTVLMTRRRAPGRLLTGATGLLWLATVIRLVRSP